MIFVIGILTVLLVLDCLMLILLVLVQLPKKEAGAGLAFGGGATDALFGAGSGNALTKITKYVTIAFFVLLISISVLQSNSHGGKSDELKQAIERQNKQSVSTLPAGSPASGPAEMPASNAPAMKFLSTSNTVPSVPPTDSTNTPAK